jgi:peptidyl-prolyl cis-trans isomerase A (cyclophilin A)
MKKFHTLLLILSMGLMLSALQAQEKKKLPGQFTAEFKTTKGTFTIEAYKSWGPMAYERLYDLVKSNFYDSNSLFRVQKDYVVQFGIGNDRKVNEYWDAHPVKDEPLMIHNVKGTISFAREGAESRTAQIFINLADNYKLDTVTFNNLKGFPPIARVISGFETIEKFYAGYGFEPANHQDSITAHGNGYIRRHFSKVDYIITARVTAER